MEKVIFDCDNSMGVLDRDVDDGLTLLYMLGEEAIDLKLVTTTFGNDDIDVVNLNTRELIKNLDMGKTKVIYGTSIDTKAKDNEAALNIIKMIEENKGDITVIATGSMHNLSDCEKICPGILKKSKEVILMGGIEEAQFLVDGVDLKELNFSIDYEGAKVVFDSGAKITIATANMCLKVRFTNREHDRLNEDKKIYEFIKDKANGWFYKFYEDYKSNDIVLWDLNCPIYLVNKDIYIKRDVLITTDLDDLKIGYLKEDSKGTSKVTFLVDVIDKDKFNDVLFKAWDRVRLLS